MELTESGASTFIKYEAKFTAKGWVFGWFLNLLFIRPKLIRTVQSHLLEIKKTLEKENSKAGI